ncbi:hypothetical protein IC575_024363 [Cucumis melo]
MGFISKIDKPHVVCIPHPAQGHINPMLNLAKLLHHKGFHVTFVITERNHQLVLKSRRPDSLNGLLDFRFRTISDGRPLLSLTSSIEHVHATCSSPSKDCFAPFCDLICQPNSMAASPSNNVPPISCIVGDALLPFTILVANMCKIPCALLWTASTCSYIGFYKIPQLIKQGLVPLKGIISFQCFFVVF